MPLLNIQSVSKSFTDPAGAALQVVNQLSMEMQEGESLVISGPSGCGKSTLLNLIAGIVQADSGSVHIGDTDIQSLSESARDSFRGKHIGYIFQNHNLLQGMSAADNVRIGGFFSGQAIEDAAIEQALEQVGLKDFKDYLPTQLSLGQQQRVAIARALIHKPKLILADEPSSSLDAEHAQACIGLLLELAAEQKAAVLMVSHDERVFDQVGQVKAYGELNQEVVS